MKKILALFVFILILFSFSNTFAAPTISAPSAILIDYDSGKVLFEKNADEKMFPASTTKIMTALLVLEKGKLDDIVTISSASVAIEMGSSNMGLLVGEEISVKDLLYGLLVYSGNDAANALAEYVSGSVADFVVLMNKKSEELGLKGTNWNNTNGLPDDNHYTTARDLARVAQEAMKNPQFREIVKTKVYIIPPTNKYLQDRYLTSTNNLLTNVRTGSYLYSPAIGIKTGYTEVAKNCLVSAAQQKGMTLLCVVLGASDIDNVKYSYKDTIDLYTWAYDSFSMAKIIEKGLPLDEQPIKHAKGAKRIKLLAQNDFSAIMPADYDKEKIKLTVSPPKQIKAPVKTGDILGAVNITYNEEELGTVNLVADSDYVYSPFSNFLGFFKGIFTSALLWSIVAVIVVFLLVVRQIRYNRRRRRRINRHKYSSRL